MLRGILDKIRSNKRIEYTNNNGLVTESDYRNIKQAHDMVKDGKAKREIPARKF